MQERQPTYQMRHSMSGGTTDLLVYLQSRDEDAFRRIYERFREKALATAASRLSPEIQIVETAQAAYDTSIREALNAIKNKPASELSSKYLEALIFTVLRAKCFELYRRENALKRGYGRTVNLTESAAGTIRVCGRF